MNPPNVNQSIFRPPKPDTASGSVLRRCVTGTPKDLSTQPELPLASGSTTWSLSLLPLGSLTETRSTQEGGSSTPVCPPQNKRPIWNAKSNICQTNALDTKSYEMSVRELTGLDPDLKPFFDTALTDLYEKSWWPIEIGCPDSGLSYSASLLRKQEGSSWFSANLRQRPEVTASVLSPSWERTSCQSFTFSPVDTTDGESISQKQTQTPRKVAGKGKGKAKEGVFYLEEEPDEEGLEEEEEKESQASQEVQQQQQRPRKRIKKSVRMKEKGVLLRCRKIRIVPTEAQKEILKVCFGVYRYIYNECVNAEKDGLIQGASVKEFTKWRKLLTNKDNYHEKGQQWKDSCPNHAKQQAVEEFFKNKKTALDLVVNGKLKSFDIGHKSRYRCRQETIPFERFMINKVDESEGPSRSLISTVYKRKPMEFKVMGKLPKVFMGRNDTAFTRTEMKVTKTRTGKYYAIVSYEVTQTSRFPELHGDMVAFDPGAKTFLTYHSPDGTWGEIGTFEKQQELLVMADRLKSRLKKEGSRKTSRWRRHLQRRMLKLFEKVRNRTQDLHNKICSWVVNTYRVALLPEFKTSQMVSSTRLYSKTCRKMMTWSHYKFRSKLIGMAQKYTDVKIRLCNEAYTTKQCGVCGVINHTMTLGSRTFNCPGCGATASRDGHAARNVGLRSLRFLIDLSI